jgi:hypothetical protein
LAQSYKVKNSTAVSRKNRQAHKDLKASPQKKLKKDKSLSPSKKITIQQFQPKIISQRVKLNFEKRVKIMLECFTQGNGPSQNQEHLQFAAIKLVLTKIWDLAP